jgi:hypothetical protein
MEEVQQIRDEGEKGVPLFVDSDQVGRKARTSA